MVDGQPYKISPPSSPSPTSPHHPILSIPITPRHIKMRALTLLAALSAAGASVTASPLGPPKPPKQSASDINPFLGRKLFANPKWAAKLESTYNSFIAKGDRANAAVVRKAQKTGTFVWVTSRSGLTEIDDAINAARAEQRRTGQKQVVGLVLYNLPDRDCSAGESAGELSSKNDGLRIYKEEFVKPYARKLAAAKDLQFAVVLEPDSLGNAVTNMGVEFCKQAVPTYQEGIAFAIKQLQLDNVGLYIDAAHGGWLGWADNLPLGKLSLLFFSFPFSLPFLSVPRFRYHHQRC